MNPEVVLICPEPIRRLQQGVGIRFREMAEELSRHWRVSLWTPNEDIFTNDRYDVRPFPAHGLRGQLDGVRAVIIHGDASERYLHELEAAGLGGGPPLVVDLYDPFLVDHLPYARDLGDGIYARDLRLLLRQLAAGDLFLVSSERQRVFYAGLLMGARLFDPSMYEADPTLQHLLPIAPFGVRPEAVACADASPRWKGVRPGIGPDDCVLFFGGIYDWYDPELLLDAVTGLIDELPHLRVVFSANPNPESTPQRVFDRTRERARERGLVDRAVFFVPWFPYDERFAYLRDVDVAVCLHRPSLEADLSLRTRVLDCLQAGLPVIATAGGDTASLLTASGAGWLVPPGDVDALRAAIRVLANDAARRARMGAAGAEWVRRERSWTQTLDPLIRFCADPRKRPRQAPPLADEWSPRADAPMTRVGAKADVEPEVSVIVPTHNRRRLLAEMLAALAAQERAPRFEVVVVDDGSRDDTARWLRNGGGRGVRVLTQPHRGSAAARNAGIRAARGRLIAFLGDDTVPESGWLARHYACHEAAGGDPMLAVIGHVAWHPRVKVTPFLQYLNEQGKQFGYSLIDDPRDLPFNFFYTSNASLHRQTAGAELFDEGFPYAAWEDTEFAYRLKRRGLRIDYEAAARVAHDHPTTIGRFLRRQERVGYSAVIFHARHPELGPFLGLGPDGPPPLTQSAAERVLALRVRALDRLGISSPGHWEEMLRASYVSGLHRGWRSLRGGNGGAA